MRGKRLGPGPGLWFCLRYACLLLTFFFLCEISPGRSFLKSFRSVTATAASLGLRAVGLPNTIVGDALHLDGQSGGLQIINECTAAFPILALLAFFVAFPAPLWKRAVGGGVGVISLLFLNLLRLVAAGLLLRYWPRLFAPIHDYFWQFGFMAATVGLGMIWAGWVTNRRVQRG
jgi:exosortase/archaeosortase family protein